MHLFLVSDDLGAMAHLHPVMVDSSRFEALLPALPENHHYRVYADIVQESGFAQTLTTSVEIGAPFGPSGRVPRDSDDSWFVGAPAAPAEAEAAKCALGDGLVLLWRRNGPLVEGRDQPLRFAVVDAAGQQVALQPYMGMAAARNCHPRRRRRVRAPAPDRYRFDGVRDGVDDAHPADSVAGTLGRRIASMRMNMGSDSLPGEFSIPYGFPAQRPLPAVGAGEAWRNRAHGRVRRRRGACDADYRVRPLIAARLKLRATFQCAFVRLWVVHAHAAPPTPSEEHRCFAVSF
jgi:hypothetical protein